MEGETETSPEPIRRRRRFLEIVAGVLTLSLAGVYLAISLFSAEMLTRSHNRPDSIDPREVSARATLWSVKTADGITLRGWYHPNPSSERRHLLVLVHGMWASWEEMAGLGHDLHERGYDILLFNMRGHGRSDPSRLTMGRKERGDLRAVLAWAQEEGFETDRIGWVGYSLGASTLLMEAASNPSIRVAVLDSPFGNLPAVLDSQLAEHSHLPRFFNPGILTAARFAYGVRTDDLIPIRSARSWGERPLLVIHGEADTIVPVVQARLLAREAGPSCRSLMIPGVDHVKAYEADPEHYVATVDSFFRRNLTP